MSFGPSITFLGRSTGNCPRFPGLRTTSPAHSASAATAGVLCVVGRILGRVGAVSVDTIRALGAGIVGFATSRTFPRTGAISVLHVKVGRRVLGRFVFDFRVRIAERSDDLVPTCKNTIDSL